MQRYSDHDDRMTRSLVDDKMQMQRQMMGDEAFFGDPLTTLNLRSSGMSRHEMEMQHLQKRITALEKELNNEKHIRALYQSQLEQTKTQVDSLEEQKTKQKKQWLDAEFRNKEAQQIRDGLTYSKSEMEAKYTQTMAAFKSLLVAYEQLEGIAAKHSEERAVIGGPVGKRVKTSKSTGGSFFGLMGRKRLKTQQEPDEEDMDIICIPRKMAAQVFRIPPLQSARCVHCKTTQTCKGYVPLPFQTLCICGHSMSEHGI